MSIGQKHRDREEKRKLEIYVCVCIRGRAPPSLTAAWGVGGCARVLLQNSECGLAGLDGLCLLFSLVPSFPATLPDAR